MTNCQIISKSMFRINFKFVNLYLIEYKYMHINIGKQRNNSFFLDFFVFCIRNACLSCFVYFYKQLI